MVTGTITINVSNDAALFVPVYSKADVQLMTFVVKSAGWAISSDAMKEILGFRYYRLVSSNLQTSLSTFQVEMKDLVPGTGN
jgi:hypothetical protein